MNEFILNALLQLFAIIANVSEDGISFKARNIVKSYLSKHLSSNLIRKYLRLFDDYLKIHHPEILGKEGGSGQTTLSDTQKVTEIGNAINRNLLQREKFIVFLRLVEFINEDDVMTAQELDFIRTVANTFNISDTEQSNIREFVLDSLSQEIQTDKLLIIDDDAEPAIPEVRHIHVFEMEGRIVILRHASTNTFVFRYEGDSTLYLNGYNIIPGRIEMMEQGAMVTGHKINPIYYSDIANRFFHSEASSKVHFVAEEVEFQFKNSSKGIKKFSFEKESGHLIGIMGGSGVGKSTLINLLSGKLKPQGGRITVNGIDIHKDPDKIRGLIGFVPQDDLLLEELSVFENLYFNAKLCLDHFSEHEILRRVNEILIDLELDETKRLKVGNPLKKLISGGQRKRLNIALELIREPGVLFVDEPTSGLSSHDSEKVMLLLKEQALKGRLVIANIHQPYSDIYKLFDQIMILDKGGYIIYKGNPIDAIVYFKTLSNFVNAEEGHCISCGNVMPEEILQIVEAREVNEYGKLTKERKVEPEEWHAVYKEKIESKQEILPREGNLPDIDFRVPRAFSQFRVYVARNVLSKLANRQYLLVNFLEAPLLALIIGYFTKFVDPSSGGTYVFMKNENLPVYLFMSVVVALFMGLMVSAEEIIRDRKILERESFLRLSWLSYIHSKIFVLFCISAIQTLSFVIVGNLILEINGMYLSYWLILFTTSCLANLIGLNLSSGLNSVITIYIIIPFILVPQLLFSGFTVNYDKLHKIWRNPVNVPVIGDLMTSRWAFEALAVDQFKDNKFTRNFFAEDMLKSNASYHMTLVDQLKVRVNGADYNIKTDTNSGLVAADFDLVIAEIKNLTDQGILSTFTDIDKLSPDKFNDQVLRSVTDYLNNAKDQFRDIKNEAQYQRDAIAEKLVNDLEGLESYLELEKDYYNDHLADLLLNRNQLPISVVDNRFVRKKTPVYMIPTSRYGRSHFYAPVKKLGNLTIDTFLFNFIFIWLTSILFYLTLVFDLLRRFVNWADRVKLRKK